MSEPSILAVLEVIEKHGSFVLFARTVEKLVAPDARAALHAAGILSGAGPVVTWPCERRGCTREIRANYDGARRPLVAVCSQVPTECEPVELSFEEVAQQQLSAQALVATACRLLGAVTDRAALAKLNAAVPIGDAQRPVLVATKGDPACDVFWAASPRDRPGGLLRAARAGGAAHAGVGTDGHARAARRRRALRRRRAGGDPGAVRRAERASWRDRAHGVRDEDARDRAPHDDSVCSRE